MSGGSVSLSHRRVRHAPGPSECLDCHVTGDALAFECTGGVVPAALAYTAPAPAVTRPLRLVRLALRLGRTDALGLIRALAEGAAATDVLDLEYELDEGSTLDVWDALHGDDGTDEAVRFGRGVRVQVLRVEVES